jgi:hypothetical protein
LVAAKTAKQKQKTKSRMPAANGLIHFGANKSGDVQISVHAHESQHKVKHISVHALESKIKFNKGSSFTVRRRVARLGEISPNNS